jgi:hypothetical protein
MLFFFAITFFRHGRIDAGIILLIWHNENVLYHYIDKYNAHVSISDDHKGEFFLSFRKRQVERRVVPKN